MEYWLGWVCGLGTAVAHYLLWGRRTRQKRRVGVEKPRRQRDKPSREWVETHNFLYYDGREMPVYSAATKEEKHGKNR
ncbi:MAG: hypothetical protein IJO76_08040 [Clostridia bacterium]|nr:hypothetical protein [Clostridia bacterium]